MLILLRFNPKGSTAMMLLCHCHPWGLAGGKFGVWGDFFVWLGFRGTVTPKEQPPDNISDFLSAFWSRKLATLSKYQFSSKLMMRLYHGFILSWEICFKLCSGSALAKLGQVFILKIKQNKALDTTYFPFCNCLALNVFVWMSGWDRVLQGRRKLSANSV